MEPTQLALVALAGVLSGALNVLAGGGSLFVMPLLMELGFTGPLANGTARVGVLGQNLAAFVRFRRGGLRLDGSVAWLTLAALPGAVLGALLGVRLDGAAFRFVLAAVMVAVWLWMTVDWVLKRRRTRAAPAGGEGADAAREPAGPSSSRFPGWPAFLAMVGVGFYGGFLQAGVGFLLMAVLNQLVRLDLVRVNAAKVVIVAAYTLLAVPIFASRGAVDWPAGLALTAGTAAGGWLGARLTLKRGEGLVRVVFTVGLGALVLRLLFA